MRFVEKIVNIRSKDLKGFEILKFEFMRNYCWYDLIGVVYNISWLWIEGFLGVFDKMLFVYLDENCFIYFLRKLREVVFILVFFYKLVIVFMFSLGVS